MLELKEKQQPATIGLVSRRPSVALHNIRWETQPAHGTCSWRTMSPSKPAEQVVKRRCSLSSYCAPLATSLFSWSNSAGGDTVGFELLRKSHQLGISLTRRLVHQVDPRLCREDVLRNANEDSEE